MKIVIDNTEVKSIINKLNDLEFIICELAKETKNPLPTRWLDNQKLMQLLEISLRSIQSWRDSNVLPYSQIGNKIFYKASDIQKLLEKHYKVVIGF